MGHECKFIYLSCTPARTGVGTPLINNTNQSFVSSFFKLFQNSFITQHTLKKSWILEQQSAETFQWLHYFDLSQNLLLH